jgi:hypothetical protein
MFPVRWMTANSEMLAEPTFRRRSPNRSGEGMAELHQVKLSGAAVAVAAQDRDSWRRRGDVVAAAFVLWLVPSTGLILKYTGRAGLLLLPLAGLSAIIVVTAILSRRTADLSARWLVGAAGLAALLFALFYPLAHSGFLGPGSDRDDGLNVALHALTGLHDPYRMTSFLGHPLTPMPGALILALPFYLIGNSAFQNLFWVPVFIWWTQRWFGATSAALWCVLVFIVGCPASLRDFVTGGDYLVNALYVAIAMDIAYVVLQNGRRWHLCAATIFLSVAISSRPIYAIAVPVLAGTVFQSGGWRRMVEFLVQVGLACAVINGPLYFYDPSHFPIMQTAKKISDIPSWFHAPLILPAIGALIGFCSFFIRMDRGRIFGLTALSLVPLFYIVLAYRLLVIHTFPGATSFEYSLPVSIFGGIWVSDRFARKFGLAGRRLRIETQAVSHAA